MRSKDGNLSVCFWLLTHVIEKDYRGRLNSLYSTPFRLAWTLADFAPRLIEQRLSLPRVLPYLEYLSHHVWYLAYNPRPRFHSDKKPDPTFKRSINSPFPI